MSLFLQFIVQINNLAISQNLSLRITCTQCKVRVITNYEFQFRINSQNLTIPSDSVIKIRFPLEYAYDSQQQIFANWVVNVYQENYNGIIKNNVLTIQKAFPNDSNNNLLFTILNIQNPLYYTGNYYFNFTIENTKLNFFLNTSTLVNIIPGNLVAKAQFIPNITYSISQLNFQVIPQHQIKKQAKLLIGFMNYWYYQFYGLKNISTIQSNTSCSNKQNTSKNLNCTIIKADYYYNIIVDNIFDSDHDANIGFSFTINDVLSNPTVETKINGIIIQISEEGVIDTNHIYIQQIVATQMNVTTFNSNNVIVGTIINQLNITIKFQQIILPYDTIEFKFPQNIIYEKENVELRDQKNMMNFSIPDFNDALKIITFTIVNFFPGISIIQNQTILMNLIINITIPWTTQPNYITIIFKRYKYQYLKGTGSLTPKTNNIAVELQTQTTQINKYTKYKFIIDPESIMNSSAYLLITFPDQIQISNANNCRKKTIINIVEIPCENDTEIKNHSIKIANLFEAGYSSKDQFYVSFENIKNPSKVNNIGPFRITTYSSLNQFKIDQNQQLNFDTSYGILDPTKIKISSASQVVNQLTIYTITLTILNEVSSLSQIQIQFPTQFQIDSLNTCQVNSLKCGCSKDTSNQKVFLFNFLQTEQTFNSGQEVQIKIGDIRNPKSTQRVNGIAIKIFNDCQQHDSCSDSKLQDIGLNLFYMVSQPSQLNLTIRPQQKTNGQLITYYFDITFDYRIENKSILQITFPQSMSVTINPNCFISTVFLSQQPLQCQYLTSTRTLTISITSTYQILGLHTISVQQIKNAKSFKKNELDLELFLSDGVTKVQKRQKFGITNTEKGMIDKAEFSFNSSLLGQESKITMNVSIKNSLDSDCLMEVQFPDSYKLSDPLNCNDERISCSKKNNNILRIQMAQVIDHFLNLTVQTITNPLQFDPQKQDFRIRTYQSTNFPIDQGTFSYEFKKQCQLACRTCPSNQLDFCLSCYTNKLITDQNFLQQSKCVQKCKDTFFLFQNKCLNGCPDGYYQNKANRVCQQCLTNCYNCSNSYQCIQCYPNFFLQKLICVSSCTYGYENGRECSPCANLKCKKCSLPDACVQCYQGFLLAKDRICYSQCPEQYPVLQDNKCVDCPSDCIQCDSKGMCLQCSINLYVFKGKCFNQCPQFYQLSADKRICQLILIQNSLNAFTKSPFPILIATLLCLASIFVSKFQARQTIVPASIVGIVSILELSAWLALLITYSSSINQLNKQTILLIIGICLLFLLNMVHLVFYFKYLSKDETFQNWKEKKLNRISNCIVLILSLFTFKAYHLIYSRYFGFGTFSASWKKITLLFPLDALGIISIFLNSTIMIIGASLIASQQNLKNYFSQAFILSLEVIIISSFMIMFLICNCKKNEKMFTCGVQKSQLLKLSSVDNKNKSMQKSVIQEIQKQTYTFNQNNIPAFSKQKLNKVVPIIQFQETKQIRKNLLLSDDDPSFLQNQKIKDQQKKIKILKVDKKVNNKLTIQSEQQNKQNSTAILKKQINTDNENEGRIKQMDQQYSVIYDYSTDKKTQINLQNKNRNNKNGQQLDTLANQKHKK